MGDLENILQEFFHCKRPFKKNGKLTVQGEKAYSQLEELMYQLDFLGVLSDKAHDIVEKLGEIVRSEV